MENIKDNSINDDVKRNENTDNAEENKIHVDSKENTVNDNAKENTIYDDSKENTIYDDSNENEIHDNPKKSTVNEDAKESKIDKDAKENEINVTAKVNATNENAKKSAINEDAKEIEIKVNAKEDTTNEDAKKRANNEDAEEDTANEDAKKNTTNDNGNGNEIYDHLLQQSLCFVRTLSCYLTKCYNAFNRKNTDMEEVHLPGDCKTILKGSINRYKSTRYFQKFLPFSRVQNRYEELKSAFQEQLTIKGNVLPHSEFLRLSALYILTAIDLKEKAGFDEAPDAAIDAITDTIIATKQQGWLNLWY